MCTACSCVYNVHHIQCMLITYLTPLAMALATCGPINLGIVVIVLDIPSKCQHTLVKYPDS